MLRYLFIPILIVGCVQPAIKRPTTTLPEQDLLQGANRLEHYLSSLNEMCSENSQRISSLKQARFRLTGTNDLDAGSSQEVVLTIPYVVAQVLTTALPIAIIYHDPT